MAGLVAAVAAEAAMEPGTVRRAGGGASVVGGTPGGAAPAGAAAGSYTHLTLPTVRLAQLTVVAGLLYEQMSEHD